MKRLYALNCEDLENAGLWDTHWCCPGCHVAIDRRLENGNAIITAEQAPILEETGQALSLVSVCCKAAFVLNETITNKEVIKACLDREETKIKVKELWNSGNQKKTN